MSVVLDCSVTLSWFIPDEQGEFALETLEKTTKDGAIVPFHWIAEMSNGLLMALRRNRINEYALEPAFAALREMPMITDRMPPDGIGGGLILFARNLGLTVYDALYLECAQRSNLPLATIDKSLGRAAKSVGVPVLGPYA